MARQQTADAKPSIPSAQGFTYIRKSDEESKGGFERARVRPQTSSQISNARAAHQAAQNSRVMKQNKIYRPRSDFMPDSALDEIVHCDICDEQLIKAFMSDHQCD